MPAHVQPLVSQTSASTDDIIATAARSLAGDQGYDETLRGIARLATEIVPGCTAAGISVPTRHVPTTVVVTDPGVQVAEQMQLDLGQGPSLDALAQTATTWSLDVAHDSRWPRWGIRAHHELGVTSTLSCPLYTSTTTLGVLALYGTSPVGITSADVPRVGRFAAVAAAAMEAAHTAEHLRRSIESRQTIGQAQGILMSQLDLDPERAFAVMDRISQDTNTKLIAVARRVVDTRSRP